MRPYRLRFVQSVWANKNIRTKLVFVQPRTQSLLCSLMLGGYGFNHSRMEKTSMRLLVNKPMDNCVRAPGLPPTESHPQNRSNSSSRYCDPYTDNNFYQSD